MADIVISEFMDAAAVEGLARDFDVQYDPKLVDQPDSLKGVVASAQALIVRNRTKVNADLLDAAPNLKAVGRLGVGLDNIDLDACGARGIQVLPATGANDVSVAEYVIAGALMLLRGAYTSTADVANGLWPRDRLIGLEVNGERLGLIGFGNIARAVARRAAAFDMEIAAYDPFVPADDPAWVEYGVTRVDDLGELLGSCRVLSLHVPLLDSTRHMINAETIGEMRKGTVIINAARGGVIDEAALAAALTKGHLGGAMLDVFEHEPLAGQSVLAGVNNLILTPHIAGVTVQSNTRVSQVTADNVRKVLEAAS